MNKPEHSGPISCDHCGWYGRTFELEKVSPYLGRAKYYCPSCGKIPYTERDEDEDEEGEE
jgi:predicted RNA-binding Zn-ribbon protein involved in translation (DUF1610 family)